MGRLPEDHLRLSVNSSCGARVVLVVQGMCSPRQRGHDAGCSVRHFDDGLLAGGSANTRGGPRHVVCLSCRVSSEAAVERLLHHSGRCGIPG